MKMKLVRWMFITSAVLIIHSKAGVQFPALGKGDSYIVQNNECNGTNGFPVFSFLKYLLSFMQPNEGPNGKYLTYL